MRVSVPAPGPAAAAAASSSCGLTAAPASPAPRHRRRCRQQADAIGHLGPRGIDHRHGFGSSRRRSSAQHRTAHIAGAGPAKRPALPAIGSRLARVSISAAAIASGRGLVARGRTGNRVEALASVDRASTRVSVWSSDSIDSLSVSSSAAWRTGPARRPPHLKWPIHSCSLISPIARRSPGLSAARRMSGKARNCRT